MLENRILFFLVYLCGFLTNNRPFPSSLVPLFESEFKVQNHSYENDFDLHENETACRTHFHMKGFTLRLVLKQRHKRTRKWSIPVT